MNKISPLICNNIFLTQKNNLKIDPKKLGYVSPDSTINFRNSIVALKYAKNGVLDALKKKKPFERLFLINNSRVMKQFDGYRDSVCFNLREVPFDTMVHGHPDSFGKGKTAPISTVDIATLFSSSIFGAKRSIVYNSEGEYSMWIKESKYKNFFTLNYDEKQKIFLKNESEAKELEEKLTDNVWKIAGQILADIHKHSDLNEFMLSIRTGISEENFVKLVKKFLLAKSTHIMLKECAQEMGGIYKTNFSNYL